MSAKRGLTLLFPPIPQTKWLSSECKAVTPTACADTFNLVSPVKTWYKINCTKYPFVRK